MSTMQPSRLPRVVIDVEKLRNIHSGLGLFSLSLARELLNQHPQTIHPVLLARPGIQQHFEGQSFETIEVRVWRKEEISKYIRPMVRPFLENRNTIYGMSPIKCRNTCPWIHECQWFSQSTI